MKFENVKHVSGYMHKMAVDFHVSRIILLLIDSAGAGASVALAMQIGGLLPPYATLILVPDWSACRRRSVVDINRG